MLDCLCFFFLRKNILQKQAIYDIDLVCLDGNIQTSLKNILVPFHLKGMQNCMQKQFVKQNYISWMTESNPICLWCFVCLMFLFGCNIQLIAFATKINNYVFWVPASKFPIKNIDDDDESSTSNPLRFFICLFS